MFLFKTKPYFEGFFALIGVIASLIYCYDYFIVPDIGLRFLHTDNLQAGLYKTIPNFDLHTGDLFYVGSIPSPESNALTSAIGIHKLFKVRVDNIAHKLEADVEFDIYNESIFKSITIFEPINETFLGLNIFFSFQRISPTQSIWKKLHSRFIKKDKFMVVKSKQLINYLPIKLPKELFPVYLSGKQSQRFKTTIDLTSVFMDAGLKVFLVHNSEEPVLEAVFSLNFQTTEGLKEISKIVDFALYKKEIQFDLRDK